MNGYISPRSYVINNKGNGQECLVDEDSLRVATDLSGQLQRTGIKKSEYKAEVRESEDVVESWLKEINDSLLNIRENLDDKTCLESQKETVIALLGCMWKYYKDFDYTKAKMSMTVEECLRVYKDNLFDGEKVDIIYQVINSLSSSLYSEEEFKEHFKKLLKVGFKPISL